MNKRIMVVMAVFMALVILFVVVSKMKGTVVQDPPLIILECSADADCVAATCCHASEAVPLSEAPECSGIFCTTECAPGTLDCGQGEIKCLKGKCEVVLS